MSIATLPRTVSLAAYGVSEPVPETTMIMAFDPGGTTGWFRAAVTPDGRIDEQSIAYGEEGPHEHHTVVQLLLEATLQMWPHLLVVSERYIPQFGKAQNTVALEYIGVMKMFARRNLVSFELQNRADKDWWTHSRLDHVGLWPKGMRHAQDAARHWAAYATKQNKELEKRLLWALR